MASSVPPQIPGVRHELGCSGSVACSLHPVRVARVHPSTHFQFVARTVTGPSPGISDGRRRKSSQEPSCGRPGGAVESAGGTPRGGPPSLRAVGEELGRGGLSGLRGKSYGRRRKSSQKPTKKNCIAALAHHKARTAYLMNLAALRFQLGRMSPLMILI